MTIIGGFTSNCPSTMTTVLLKKPHGFLAFLKNTIATRERFEPLNLLEDKKKKEGFSPQISMLLHQLEQIRTSLEHYNSYHALKYLSENYTQT